VRHRGWLAAISLTVVMTTAFVVARASLVAAADKDADAAAVEFARTHHPELAGLLDQLRKSAPKEYAAAIGDLNRSRERLDKTRERLPERYELELAEWKINSRIRLLAARLAMGGDDELEAELRSALRDRTNVRLKLLQDERERTAKRLSKLDEQIADQRSQVDKIVDRELAAIQKDAANTTAKAAKAAKARDTGVPAAKPNPAKSDVKKPAAKPAASDKPKSNSKSSEKK
jgi:hypothetical protein